MFMSSVARKPVMENSLQQLILTYSYATVSLSVGHFPISQLTDIEDRGNSVV